ncbi:peptidase domain-containing ABC transporter [Janthinobacterium sp. RB2R34]|uniref:peptidase domain-containing ABC transporter n=1 Tax=Janthinobacterium sp. RB2R34 TaxID=3424193 RepID=UPI003F24FFE5
MKTILQSEASECALVSLAMICSAHGLHADLPELRRRFQVSLNGATLEQLIRWATKLGFSTRAVRLEIDELPHLQLPCILHWNLNHMVVLKSVGDAKVTILDPAIGERKLALKEVSVYFTGVALELTPTSEFVAKDERKQISLKTMTGRVIGLKRSLLQIFVVSVVLQLFAVAAPLLNQVVVDEVFGANDKDLLPVLIFGSVIALLVQSFLSVTRGWMIMVLSQTLSLQWTGNVFNHLMRLPMVYFERRHLGDLLSRFGSISSIQNTLTVRIVTATLDSVMVVVALGMMLLYSPLMSMVAIASSVLYAGIRILSYHPYRDAAKERLMLSARNNSHFLETMRAILPIKLFGREENRIARWKNMRVDVQNRDVRTSIMNIWFSSANTIISGAQDLAMVGFGAMLVMNSGVNGNPIFSIGMFFAFSSYSGQFIGKSLSLIDFAIELKMLNLHSERLADIVLESPELDSASDSDLKHLDAVVELRNVSFRYGDGEPWVLKDVSLKIISGENLVFVGPSGCGKSTLLKLILGLLEPNEGEVLYGGINIRQLGLRNYRQLIGTVMQEDSLLAGSIAENISFFDPHINMDKVVECASFAALSDEVNRMPMGFHTLVGDLGSSLSGGQKQRVLLARAMYKSPKIMALDEATSHMDIRNEKIISQKLSELNVIRIVVAHRPETIASANRVVCLQNGTIVEEGSDFHAHALIQVNAGTELAVC